MVSMRKLHGSGAKRIRLQRKRDEGIVFGRKKKPKKLWTVKLHGIGSVPINVDPNEWTMDLTKHTFIDINSKVIDCDNGGTCETSTDGGFRIEVIPQ